MSHRIVLISSDPTFEDQLQAAVDSLKGDLAVIAPDVSSVAQTVTVALANRPHLVVVGPGIDEDDSVDLLERIDREYSQATTVLVTQPNANMWRRVLQAGARDLFVPDISVEELTTSLADLLKVSDRLVGSTLMNILEGGVPASAGRLITVASPKGGCGKTMMAANLAAVLQQRGLGPVVLVDLDLQFGDVATILGLRPEFNVGHATSASGDPTAVKAFLAQHASGLYTLCGPANPVEAESIESEELAKLLALLRAEFPFVVVDTGAGMDEATLSAFEESTDLVLMTTTDLAAINALRKTVVLLDQLHLDDAKRWVVLNRSDARVGLDKRDIEESTGLDLHVTIPSSRSVPVTMNHGTPLVLEDPKSAAARPIQGLVDLLTDQPSNGSKSWLKRRRSA